MMVSLLLFFFLLFDASSASPSPTLISGSTDELYGHTRISGFRVLNRRLMGDCPDPNPYLAINVSSDSMLDDEGNVTVTVSGVIVPDKSDWVAMISPSNSEVSDCPLVKFMYLQTGDNSSLPLLCHYPVKMRLTWVSGDKSPQKVQYGDGKSETSAVTTFTQNDMCSGTLASPAKDFGWHDPGYIHSAVMTGLKPSQSYSYRYGSDTVGWSGQIKFKTPPSAGSDELRLLAYGDMGKAPLDESVEHYIQPGSRSVIEAMAYEVSSGDVDSVFHIGDISYATGFLVEWDFFLNQITPVASHVSYMTAIGNHERDYADSGSVYQTPDSGGECGVAYEKYFPMPTSAIDKPWYSIEQASVHFTVISTEHPWEENSEQYAWIKKDLASVDRARTPWIIFMGHRPMYSTHSGIFSSDVDPNFVGSVEPLLLDGKVDLALFGHVHNYERTCAVYQNECKGMPSKDKNGVDTYDNNNYTAPVHAIIGMAGFSLDNFPSNAESWSLARITEFGYTRIHATRGDLRVEFVNSNTRQVQDRFHFIKDDN
ncbi:uncharacterized protein A4U43_C02F18730 [Asparagus officinalis]|uniref:Purple acid phosphatase n=1 Tax=Asparagus officinalis TaxID=4686 RepID=A0A5P1FJ80_ASPOF|nr:uncharacterized protein A4U43_C02F18730 [Asparagus officinalis]